MILLFAGGSGVGQNVQFFSLSVDDPDGEGHTTIQVVRGAGNSRVIGAHRHLYFVEKSLVISAVSYERCRRLLDAHVHRCDVVGRADNEVGLCDAPVVVGCLVMNQCAARGFNAAYSSACLGFNRVHDLRVCYRIIVEQFKGALAGIAELNEPGIMVQESVL